MSLDKLDGTDLAALHQAIVEDSAAAFPGVRFEFYRNDRKNLPLGDGVGENPPRAYALLELSEMEADDTDPGTEQQAMVAKFEALMVLKNVADPHAAKVAVRALAGSFAAFLRTHGRFGKGVVLAGAPMVAGCFKDDFNPELDQFEVWRVEWLQSVWLGEGAVWKSEGTTPQIVLYSYVPLIGTANVDQYQLLEDMSTVVG